MNIPWCPQKLRCLLGYNVEVCLVGEKIMNAAVTLKP